MLAEAEVYVGRCMLELHVPLVNYLVSLFRQSYVELRPSKGDYKIQRHRDKPIAYLYNA